MGQLKKSEKRYRINNIGIGKSARLRTLIQNKYWATKTSRIWCLNAKIKGRIISIEFISAQLESTRGLGRARYY